MKVYVVETGCYSDRGVAGVYDCPERAMAAFKGNWEYSTYSYQLASGEVVCVETWHNDLDWQEAAAIHAEEVISIGPKAALTAGRNSDEQEQAR